MKQAYRADLLSRYLSGDVSGVWSELWAISMDAHVSPDVVRAVCEQTMQRVRRNLERIVEWLSRRGYAFYALSPVRPPDAKVDEHVREIERVVGRVPPALVAFWSVVGSVDPHADAKHSHPPWSRVPGVAELGARDDLEYLDPLIVESSYDALLAVESWTRQPPVRRSAFTLGFTPDRMYKAHDEGDGAESMSFEEGRVDALVLEGPKPRHFVRYLQDAIARAGFLGLPAEVPRTVFDWKPVC